MIAGSRALPMNSSLQRCTIASAWPGARELGPRGKSLAIPGVARRPEATAGVHRLPELRLAGDVGRLRLLRQILAGLLIDRLHAELDLAPVIDAQHLDLDLVAHGDDVAGLLDPLRGQLADMDEAVTAAEEVHEGAE